MPPNLSSDAALWDQLRQGQQSAYLAVYEQYSEVLFQYGKKFTSDRELVLDCLHDLFLDIWDRRQHLGPTDSIKFYLFRSLRRRIARSSATLPYEEVKEADTIPIDSSEFRWIADETIENKKHCLQQTISSLPERQREVIYLRFYNNFSFEEIAEIMKIDVRSAYNLTYKALGKLRTTLSPKQQLMLGAALTGLGILFANFL